MNINTVKYILGTVCKYLAMAFYYLGSIKLCLYFVGLMLKLDRNKNNGNNKNSM